MGGGASACPNRDLIAARPSRAPAHSRRQGAPGASLAGASCAGQMQHSLLLLFCYQVAVCVTEHRL